jgi:6-phosphogluconolactonase (cycloisomerase 2 family)
MKRVRIASVTLCWLITISGCNADLSHGLSTTSAPVAVPNVVGDTEAAAQTLIVLGAGLTLGTVTYESSSTVAANTVISQTPLAGTSVAGGSAVTLTVSSGPQAYAYVANAGANAGGVGTISAYSISGATGALQPLASSPVSVTGSKELYDLHVDPSGQYLYVIDYGGNQVFAFSIDANGHALTPVSGSPFATGSGPSSLAFDSSGSFVYIANNTDATISAYSLDKTTGVLSEQTGSPYTISGGQASPRQMVSFGNFLYVADSGINSIDVFAIAATTGALTEGVPGSPFATDTGPFSITIDPTGAVLYTANSGTNSAGSISAFTLDATTGELLPVADGPLKIPVTAYIAVDSMSRFLFVTESSGIAVYPITLESAALGTAVTGSPFSTGGTTPFSVSVSPSDLFVYSANNGSNNIAEFSFNSTTGVLTTVTGSPANSGSEPGFMALD